MKERVVCGCRWCPVAEAVSSFAVEEPRKLSVVVRSCAGNVACLVVHSLGGGHGDAEVEGWRSESQWRRRQRGEHHRGLCRRECRSRSYRCV